MDFKYLRGLTLKDDWDLEGAKAIPGVAWGVAERVYEKVPDCHAFASPCGDGSVHISWRELGLKVTVEVHVSQDRKGE